MFILFALGLSLVVPLVGFAVDYARLSSAKTKLQTILDSGVLAAVHESTAEGAQLILSQYAASQAISLNGASNVSATITKFDALNVEARGAATVRTVFGKFYDASEFVVSAKSAALRTGGYRNYVFALDFSSSLGMGATDADRAALEALTQPYVSSFYGSRLPQGCAFACHRREGWEPGAKTLYETAHDAGIKLREDELLTQFGGLVDLLLDSADPAVQNNQRTLSVYGFSSYARELISNSTSPATLKASLANFPESDRFETVFDNALPTIETMLGAQGDGSQASPKKMLILITDGIDSRDAFFAQKAIDPNLCGSIRKKGFDIAVVEIKYPKLVSNALYDDTVAPVENTISPAMQQCASPGWYFQAQNEIEVPAKFLELKNQLIASTPRLIR